MQKNFGLSFSGLEQTGKSKKNQNFLHFGFQSTKSVNQTLKERTRVFLIVFLFLKTDHCIKRSNVEGFGVNLGATMEGFGVNLETTMEGFGVNFLLL